MDRSKRYYPRALRFGGWLCLSLCLAPIVQLGCVPEAPSPDPAETPDYVEYGYTLITDYPHDTEAFTQGLDFESGDLYEGTGLRGRSSLRRVDLSTGEVLQQRALDDQYFGEGITILEDRIYQLTWTSNVGFVYDRESFELLETFNYPTDGWGLTHDEQQLIMSDGTSRLYFLDPDTFEQNRVIEVYEEDTPANNLNELEYIHGKIYANVWRKEHLLIIDPDSGKVEGKVFLNGLLTPQERLRVDVLNGIAYDEAEDRLFVTGKYWPKVFEISLVALD